MSSGRRSSRNVDLSIGCVTLFLLPFAGVGLFTAVMAVHRIAAGNWTEALFFGLFALTFGGVGIGGIAAVVAGRRTLKAQEALQASHPESPWLWRADWASGHITDSSRSTMIGAWLFATLWNLIGWPTGFLSARAALKEGKPAAFLGLLFPLVGVGLVVRAIRATLRHRRYGVSRLELATVPGIIGRSLIGMVRAPSSIHAAQGFDVTLTCVRRVTHGGGKQRSTSESVLWQDVQRVQGQPYRAPARMETHIPVAFRVSGDAPSSADSDSANRIVWRLQVSAELPGVNYESRFDVPVFRTPASEQPLSPEETRLTEPADPAGYQQPADSRILVTATMRGTEILFPAARNLGAAVSLTAFLVLWLGGLGLQIYFGAPLIFPIVTALFAVLFLIVVLDLWLQVSRVTVHAGAVSWATGYIVPGREHTITASDIADVTSAIGMQAGSRVYYDVVIVRKVGKKAKVGHSVRDKREAEWLAGTIKQVLTGDRSEVREPGAGSRI
jgi:hypothetical protein